MPRSHDGNHGKKGAFSSTGLQPSSKKVVCALCSILAASAILAVVIAVRHVRRGGELRPLVSMLAGSQVCLEPKTGTCAVEVSTDVRERFDLHQAEVLMLGYLFNQVLHRSQAEMKEVLCGAHIVLEDADGSGYRFLTTLPGAHKRISSHVSERAQYGIPEGHVLSSMLVGTISNRTWLQLEGSDWNPRHDLWRSLGHILDFLEYQVLRLNVGPLGISRATDGRPILSGRVARAREACPKMCAEGSGRQPGGWPREASKLEAAVVLADAAGGAAGAPFLRSGRSAGAGIHASTRHAQALTLDN